MNFYTRYLSTIIFFVEYHRSRSTAYCVEGGVCDNTGIAEDLSAF